MSMFSMPSKESRVNINAKVATEMKLIDGMEATGKLHSFIPTKNDSGFMLEIHVGDTHSVLTYAKTSSAKLAAMLGGKIGLVYRGVSGDYANFTPKFLFTGGSIE